ncbi:MAG: hypothetical protein B5M56_10585 [Desulfococcus sp. 4484_241]|nr:MAG: hypothetical protein B5M56_10585 [Desulfococcus sp. 4484_241]
MIRAGKTNEISTESGEWLILDIGFANKTKSCCLLINERDPEELQFSEAVRCIRKHIDDANKPVNLIVEAPLSVAFDAKGNPKGRSVEKQGSKTRYWYVGPGCTVMVATIYLVKALYDSNPSNEVRLFEGFVSFKNTNEKSNHSRDVQLLREVIEMPNKFRSSIIDPDALKTSDSDVLQSAFWVAGIDTGIPPLIQRNG